MEGFKTLAKGVKCFKEGGSVYKSRHSEKSEKKSDMTQDKSMVKKGVKQHEAALHKGEPKTELKLKQGGRSKKAVGTVKKFEKASGEYGAKKTASDKKNIQQAKQFKPKKMQYGGMTGPASAGLPAAAPSGAMGQGQISNLEKQRNLEKMKRAQQYLGAAQQSELIKQDPRAAGLMRKKGGKVKKCATGGSIDEGVRARAMKFVEDIKGSDIEDEAGTVKGSIKRNEYGDLYDSEMKAAPKKEKKLIKPDYSNEDLDRMGMNESMNEMPKNLRGPNYKAPSVVKTVSKEVTKPTPRSPSRMIKEESEYAMKSPMQDKGERLMKMLGMKKGGKVKKCADGGALKETNAEENPGLAKLPTNVRNKMGYMRKGGKAKKMMNGGTC
jgi:hypothetical protein